MTINTNSSIEIDVIKINIPVTYGSILRSFYSFDNFLTSTSNFKQAIFSIEVKLFLTFHDIRLDYLSFFELIPFLYLRMKTPS